MPDEFVAGLVLAAGGSSRLGQPKQLLPFRGTTLLGYVLDTARSCRFDQLVVALGGAAEEIGANIDLGGADVVVNEGYGEGCSSSIAAALAVLHAHVDTLVLMLGDQPGVEPATVEALVAGRGDAPLAVCLYDDGRGHPFAFGRAVFDDLASLHGDKGVWKLLDRRADEVVEVAAPGNVPLDVDTWEDYQALLAAATRRETWSSRTSST
jgi:molybdenum cofactor cytidylyltransferase